MRLPAEGDAEDTSLEKKHRVNMGCGGRGSERERKRERERGLKVLGEESAMGCDGMWSVVGH